LGPVIAKLTQQAKDNDSQVKTHTEVYHNLSIAKITCAKQKTIRQNHEKTALRWTGSIFNITQHVT